ncbi:transcriptional regulator [Virgisporangium aliadipatigenens]|uniref:Transcriptional regulator n=1 Tax=Virgisporangium aliadipatigenens TaxID=741659 RepID=A0A8J3YS30_9ACTN|nr:helix-turn-helix transcriptional regulator [Virgisporangium aliadipatigenens]GIJ48713.1 transcriptional regulator [Virgisporangium aliadipatigenens]
MTGVTNIGEQLGRLRTQRGLTQEQLHERSGVSVDVIKKLEQGTRSTCRIGTLVSLAEALDANVSVLITPRTRLAPLDEHDPALDAIRQAVTCGSIPGLDEPDEPEPAVPTLAEGAATAWRVWQRGDYSTVAALLPTFVAEARHACRDLAGDDRVEAFGHLASAYETAAGVAIMLGMDDLAWLAAERAVAAGEQSGTSVVAASSRHWAAWILRRQGRYGECVSLATRAAEEHEPSLMRASDAELAVWGGLLVTASGAAARADRPEQADELLSYARGAAARLGREHTDRWSVFGPRLLAHTAVMNAVEGGDYERALHLAETVDQTRGTMPPTWEARYLLGLAQAQVERHKDQSAVRR